VIGKLGPPLGKFADNLATLNMTPTITKESTFPTRGPPLKVLPCRRKSATSKGSGALVPNSATASAQAKSFEPTRNKRQRLPFELIFPLASEAFQCITTSRN
jgi:hypothetical protein